MKEKFIDNLRVSGQQYKYYSIDKASNIWGSFDKMPFSLKIILENLLRNVQDDEVKNEDILSLHRWLDHGGKGLKYEISYLPTRVLMQDFTGVPAVVDLAAMRDGMVALKCDPKKINPVCPVHLVIDHSVMVDFFHGKSALGKNERMEFERNKQRYSFLKWGSKSFNNFNIVPPASGICHQINLENLSKVVWQETKGNDVFLFPDTCIGTDSHTTMVNALGILAWGVGGIEAEARLLGQSLSLLIPQVVGVELKGKLPDMVSATDLVLNIVQQLRQLGVVGKFVEFFGSGLSNLSIPHRATISNMAPEYGATCGIFPIDDITIDYLKMTGRTKHRTEVVKAYALAQGMWRDDNRQAIYSDKITIKLNEIVPSIAGPKRPQDRIALSNIKHDDKIKRVSVPKRDYKLGNKDLVLAAITSCTNTSNPQGLITAALIAKKAASFGGKVPKWVKTSIALGSRVVADYLKDANLIDGLEAIGFYIVAYGCTSCIGNSGPLDSAIVDTINKNNLQVSGILSGNRNFEGRINPYITSNYLASPALVVLYALAGTMNIDITHEPIFTSDKGHKIYLKDLWPDKKQVLELVEKHVKSTMFAKEYSNIYRGQKLWQEIEQKASDTYAWDQNSSYIKLPPFFDNMTAKEKTDDILGMRPLLILGDSITTDHISPAGAFSVNSPAGQYLVAKGVPVKEFNSYGSRRGNHELMMRGTFANIRINNEMLHPLKNGGFTLHYPTNKQMSVFDASELYAKENIPLMVIAGKEYGTGSSRDWAAKGPLLLGVKVVIAESFERIHRSNLVAMGILPLEFKHGQNRNSLNLKGNMTYDLLGLKDLEPNQEMTLLVYDGGDSRKVHLINRIDTRDELAFFHNKGILRYMLRKLNKEQ